MKRINFSIIASLTLIALSACSDSNQSSPQSSGETPTTKPASIEQSKAGAMANVTTQKIANAHNTPQEWLTYGGTYDEQRHSRLTAINSENISELGVNWTYDLATSRGVEATPIIVDGAMYVTSAWSVVHAIDAKTGAELWVYDPKVDRSIAVNACCDVVNRGVAVYEGKIFVGVIDGRLEALDATTGTLVWSKITVDQSKPYTITGAPRVVNDKVLIGNGGAEFGVRGYLTAYDSSSGEKVWRFYTTPNPNKQPDDEASDAAFEKIGNITWGDEGEWKKSGGGGTVWDSIIYDTKNDSIIFGVGNASPWNQTFRDPSGKDNLFTSSIVAVDASSGAYKWHFQTTPADRWDYTATQSLILANLPLGDNGEDRRVVMQAPKNGYFYVLDALTGEFIKGAGYVPQNWTTGLTDTGRPIEVKTSPAVQTPGPLGGHNWHPMAFNPELGLAYIPAQEVPQAFQIDRLFESKPTKWNTGYDFAAGVPPIISTELRKIIKAMTKGRLIAWDPVLNKPAWIVEHSGPFNGGVLSTASNIIFQGKLNGEFVAYDAANGDVLWQQDVQSGAISGPATYEIDGEQYVTITTGWGSAWAVSAGYAFDEKVSPTVGKVVTFKLGGKKIIEQVDGPRIERVTKAEEFGDEAQLADGLVHYARNCGVCHGAFAESSGVLPDLRWSAFSENQAAWKSVVIDGALKSNGMVSFANYLTEQEVENIRAYVVQQAHNANDVTENTQKPLK